MNDQDVAAALHGIFVAMLKVGAVPMLTVLGVGLGVSFVQSITQINEQTLAFVPKLVALIAVLSLTGDNLVTSLEQFALADFDRMIVAGAR